MNLEEQGLGILKLYKKGNEGKGKGKKEAKGQIIYVTPDDEDVKHPIPEIKLDPGDRLALIPAVGRERSVLYVTGAAGSGKSYFSLGYIKEYHKMFPKRGIYLFSSLSEDKTLDSCKFLKRFRMDETFLTTALTLSDFKDTLTVFDDIDIIKNRPLKKKVFGILDTLLQTGRHQGCDVIFTSHLACNSYDTKIILAECTSITIFPRTLSGRSQKYLLGEYLSLTKKEIKAMKKLKTRPVTIVKTMPNILLHDKGAYELGLEED